MKFKRYMAASMAAVMAVSSAIVCEISANAVDNLSISHTAAEFTKKWNDTNPESYDDATNTITFTKEWGGIGLEYSTPLDLSAYDFLELNYSASTVGKVLVNVYYNFAYDNPDTANSTSESGTVKIPLDSEKKDKVTQIIIQSDVAGTVKIDSLEATVDTDTRVPLNFEYGNTPITLTKGTENNAAVLKVLIPFNIEGITYQSSTVADLKAKYKSISYSGIKYVSDTLGLNASDIKMMIYIQTGANWGGWYQSNIVSISSDPQTLSYLVDSISADDSDPVMACGIQFYVENLDSYDKFADLAIGDTVTLNPDSTPVESVKITLSDGTAVASSYTYGDTINLNATVLPEGADGADTVEWKSSDKTVAVVDSYGIVKLLKAGDVTITATAGGVSSSVTFTVKKKKLTVAPSALTEIYVSDNKIEAAAKAVTAKYALENVENVSLVKGTDYTVSEPQISADKKYYSITITLSDDAAGKYELSTTTLKGYIAYELTSVALNSDTLNLVAGADGRQLVATTTPDNALLDNLTFTYKSSDEAVATVDENGLVTPLKAGTATITVTAKAVVTTNGIAHFTTTATAKCTVTVTDNAIPATNIELDASGKTMTVGDKAKLTATVKPADTTDKIVWTSSKPTVAAVDENGNITALAAGTTEITATAGSVSAVCKVTVEAVKVSEVKLDKTYVSLKAGETAQLTAAVTPDNAADKTVTWTSSDEKVATVADGKIIAVAPGTATITATAGGKSAACTVTVAKEAQNIKDTKKYPSVPKDYAKVDPVVTTVNSDGSKNMLIMFSISDSDVDSYRGARITFKRADGKTFSRSLILGKYYTDVTYVKDGDNYNGNGQNYIVIRLKNVQDSWGDISAKFELINGLG